MLETTLAGSLPKPAWLAEPDVMWGEWLLDGDALIEGQRDAALAWVKVQEDAGLDIVSDGEQFRRHFAFGFLGAIDGIDWQRMVPMGIRDNRYTIDVPTVTGPVRRITPVHRDSAAFCRAHTERKYKVTLPGPFTICDTIADEHYGDIRDMGMAFAEVLNQEARDLEALGVDVIQFDEPGFTPFPDAVNEWGIAALDKAVEGLRCTTTVHICYGYGIKANIEWKHGLGSEWRQYEEIFPALDRSRIKQVTTECANSRVPMSLLGLLKTKDVLVGAIDVATNDVETPEQVAATLRAAAEFVEPERIVGCTNCGMAPLPRGVAAGKLKALADGAALLRKELA